VVDKTSAITDYVDECFDVHCLTASVSKINDFIRLFSVFDIFMIVSFTLIFCKQPLV